MFVTHRKGENVDLNVLDVNKLLLAATNIAFSVLLFFHTCFLFSMRHEETSKPAYRLSEKSFVLRPNIFYPEIHEVDLWQV